MTPSLALVALPMLTAATASGAATFDLTELESKVDLYCAQSVAADLLAGSKPLLQQLQARTADCHLRAVAVTVRLAREAPAADSLPFTESLRLAVGKCTRFVLGLAMVAEAPRYCGSISVWSPAQTARELRRRIAALEADALLRSTAAGEACLAAYKYELTHTRVVLKRKA